MSSQLSGPAILTNSVQSLIQANNTSNETNLVKSLDTQTVTDTKKYTATDKKLFSNAVDKKSRKAKAFGVFETKQVIKEVAYSKVVEDDGKVKTIRTSNHAKLISMSNASGKTIVTDSDMSSATTTIVGKVTELKSIEHSSKGNGTLDFSLDSSMPVIPTSRNIDLATGSIKSLSANNTDWVNPDTGKALPQLSGKYWVNPDTGKAVPSVKKEVKNFTTDATIRKYVPDTMSLDEFSSMQKLVNGDLNQFVSCPDLLSAFGWDKHLLNKANLFDSLMSMLGLTGGHNIPGLTGCLGDALTSLNQGDLGRVTDTVISSGSMNAFSDLIANTSHGPIANPTDSAYKLMGSNFKVKLDSRGVPNNTFSNPEVATVGDNIFSSLGVSKKSVFTSPKTKNNSILDGLVDDVISTKKLNSTNPTSGFGEYCLGDVDKLLRSIPGKFNDTIGTYA